MIYPSVSLQQGVGPCGTSRLLSSITFRLDVSTFCEIRWDGFSDTNGSGCAENGGVEALGLTRKSPFLLMTFVEPQGAHMMRIEHFHPVHYALFVCVSINQPE